MKRVVGAVTMAGLAALALVLPSVRRYIKMERM
jgi:hypothetical protein